MKRKPRKGSISLAPNEVAAEKEHTWIHRLFTAARNPLVILLTVLATVSYATGDLRAGSVMLLMVILGLGLRFVQETRADTAAAKLKAMISVTATVVRNGEAREIPISQLVPGDIVQLSAGDMIPADVRLLSAKDLFFIRQEFAGQRDLRGSGRRPMGDRATRSTIFSCSPRPWPAILRFAVQKQIPINKRWRSPQGF